MLESSPENSNSRLPLTSQAAYYRSKAYVSTVSVNSLVAAASPIFTLIITLKKLLTAPDPTQIQNDLAHEIKAFEHRAQSQNYRANIILAARYALCTLIDETIHSTEWSKTPEWQAISLLQMFQGETWGGERFFFILEKSCEDPHYHIDLLELVYICLSLGVEGKYRHMHQGHATLLRTKDNLYQSIRKQRGEFSKRLLVTEPKRKLLTTNTSIKKKRRSLPIWLVAIVSALILGGIYTGVDMALKTQAQQVINDLQQIAQPTSISQAQ